MITQDQLRTVIGTEAYDTEGDKIGKVGQVYLDDETGEAEFATVKTGMFGGKETFIPLAQASFDGEHLNVPFSKSSVKDAPSVNASEGHLTQEEEAQLYHYYGLDYSHGPSDSGLPVGQTSGQTQTDDVASGRTTDRDLTGDQGMTGDRDMTRGDDVRGGTVGTDTSGPTTDNAMTRSEEELRVGQERREAGRARLRKYVVTEQQQQTVPVSHEEVRLEREPITDDNRDHATSGPDISDEEHEVTLHEEVPVTETRTVPKERVRLEKDVVRGEESVSGEVRKERIDMEGDTDR